MGLLSINIKRLVEHAEIPEYSKLGDAGLDLTAVDMYHNVEEGYIEYGTGLAVEIPEGYVGLVFPRSSVSKKSLMLANSVGVIDSNYRGEIKLRFKSVSEDMNEYFVGDRVGQLMIIPYPTILFKEVEELSQTERGDGGFGSTGS